MLMLLGECADLLHLGGGNIARENSAQASAFVMHFEHGLCSSFCIHGKKTLQDQDDEIHGGVIVVQE